MDFLAEYNEMLTIPSKSAVAYKFLSLFRVVMKEGGSEVKGLYWSVGHVDTKLSDEVLGAIRLYLRAKRQDVMKEGEKEYAKVLWFFYQKLLEVGAFDITIRGEIRAYLDLCQYIIL